MRRSLALSGLGTSLHIVPRATLACVSLALGWLVLARWAISPVVAEGGVVQSLTGPRPNGATEASPGQVPQQRDVALGSVIEKDESPEGAREGEPPGRFISGRIACLDRKHGIEFDERYVWD